MKRSEIQKAIAHARALVARQGFELPMFGAWSMDEWRSRTPEDLDTIFRTMRGWDVTDFGTDDFRNVGAVLFTVRNGLLGRPEVGCPYAEKLIIMQDGQSLPCHFHFQKTEDIINRGGGTLAIQVFNSLPDGEVDRTGDVKVCCDGLESTVQAGAVVEIAPGNSMTIRPGMYHVFAAKAGCGDLIIGEISAINDDHVDNRFAVEMRRFSEIEEDEAVTVPLVNEYVALFGR